MFKEKFSKSKGMVFPRNLLVGHDVLPEVAKMCDSFRFEKNGAIITGNKTYKSAGKLVEEYATDGGYAVSVIKTGNTSTENVNEIVSQCKAEKTKFILAVGGGSKIDISKIVSKELDVPFISIPTSAAHDGIASDRASLKSEKGSISVAASSPLGVIADTRIITKSPYRYLASGCADVISNKTALLDWKFAKNLRGEPFSSSAYALSDMSANTIIDNCYEIKPRNENSTWIAIRPILISGIAMSVAGSSRPTSGSEHMFSHALDYLHPGKAMHGEQCGVGAIMMMYLHGGNWRQLRNALMEIGAPVNAKQLHLKPEYVIDALVEAKKMRNDRFTILGDKGLDRKTAENVAMSTFVI